ncbi:MAG: tetratricopeptide repeat protein [Bacteroidetes bacterium]|nr:tetratricopeptide repeat protein [Bacteroidota bacterium]
MLEKNRVFFANLQCYHELIDYYERECLLDRALEVVGSAILQVGLSADFLLRNAELLLEKKQAEQALSVIDQAEILAPGCLRASILRAEGFASLGMLDASLALLDSLKEDASTEELSNIYVCEALIYDNLKEYERMFFVLKAALQENPSNTEALSRMWYVVEYARKHEESIKLHEEILEDTPYNALAWYNLGAAHHYLCNYEEAIEAYEFAFLAKEDFEFAYRDCAEVCLYVENYQKALNCYQDALERFEPDSDLFLHIGLCYEKMGNYVVARDFFQRAVEFDYYCAEAHYHIGCCFSKQKEWQKAIAVFLKAIKLEEKNEEYYSALAEAYSSVGNLKKSEFYFREAADTAPEEPAHWITLARFLMKNGRPDDALEVLDEADENTYGPELLYCRSVCLFEMGNKQEALLVLEEALYEDFDAHQALFHMMPVLEKDKEVKAVIAIFQPD